MRRLSLPLKKLEPGATHPISHTYTDMHTDNQVWSLNFIAPAEWTDLAELIHSRQFEMLLLHFQLL